MEKILTKLLEIMQKDIFWDVMLGLITMLTTLAGAKSYKDRKKRFLITYNPKYVADNVQDDDMELEIKRYSSKKPSNSFDKDLHIKNQTRKRGK